MAVLTFASETDHVVPTVGTNYQASYARVARATTLTTYKTSNSRVSLYGRRTVDEFKTKPFTAVAELWLHFIVYTENVTNSTETVLTFRKNSSGLIQARLKKSTNSTTYQMQVSVDGSAFTDVGSTFTMTNLAQHEMDIHLKFHASTGAVDVYVDGTSVVAYSGALVSADNLVDEVHFSGEETSNAKYYSEIIVADESTVGWDLIALAPTAAGTHTAWAGAYTDVDETSVTTTDVMWGTTGEQISFNFADLDGSLNRRQVKGVAVAGAGQIVHTAADLQALVRVSGADYTSGDLGVDVGLGIIEFRHTFTTNPSTSDPWRVAELNALEYGVKAV
jgi:hypothetical protein